MRRATRSLLRQGQVARRGLSSGVKTWKVESPYDGKVYCEIPVLAAPQARRLVQRADLVFQQWRETTIEQRIALVKGFIVEIQKQAEQIAEDISGQMGKPFSQARGEVNTMVSRAEALIELAPGALREEEVSAPEGMMRRITKEPVGVVLALQPWNYPLLTGVNAVVSAVLAGCPVLLKHSDRTPLCAEHFANAFKAAGAPEGLVTAFHIDHDTVSEAVQHPSIAYVQFTGSVPGGRAVYEAVAQHRFIDVGLELGGKDAAYVAEDADVDKAINGLVDGAMYNAGQSCCAVERVYVHHSHYERFLQGAVELANKYVLGDPMDTKTTLGPLAQPRHVDFVHQQVQEAASMGARVLCGGEAYSHNGKGRFYKPTVVADCTHEMEIMTAETFGPVLAVAPVENDSQAVQMMNDSEYGLTASVWTANKERALKLGEQLDVGTVFMNRCDFVDAYLPWSGRRDSGKGVAVSHLGFAPFLRTKGYNFRL